MGPVKGIPASLSKMPGACAEKMFKCLSLNQDYINEDSESHYIRLDACPNCPDGLWGPPVSYLEGIGGSFPLGLKEPGHEAERSPPHSVLRLGMS